MQNSYCTRFPKLSGTQNPNDFIALEKQIKCSRATTEGRALTNYLSLLSADKKSAYAAANTALLGCLDAVTISKLLFCLTC